MCHYTAGFIHDWSHPSLFALFVGLGIGSSLSLIGLASTNKVGFNQLLPWAEILGLWTRDCGASTFGLSQFGVQPGTVGLRTVVVPCCHTWMITFPSPRGYAADRVSNSRLPAHFLFPYFTHRLVRTSCSRPGHLQDLLAPCIQAPVATSLYLFPKRNLDLELRDSS